MRKLTSCRGRRTNPLIWLAASLCAALAVAVILFSLLLLALYVANRPRLPSVRLASARLLLLDLSPPTSIHLRLALTLTAHNRNPSAHATLTGLRALLRFRGASVAELRAGPLELPENGTRSLEYAVEATPVPVGEDGAAALRAAAAAEGSGVVVVVEGFEVEGRGKAAWRVAGLVTVRLWAHFRCEIGFFAGNGTSSRLSCA